jgi:hypothetical protein
LVNTFWRYICIPAITIPIIYGFRQIPSTRAFIQDPAYVSPFISLLYVLILVIRPSCRIHQSPNSSYQPISLQSSSPFLASIRRPHYLRHPCYRSRYSRTRGIIRDRFRCWWCSSVCSWWRNCWGSCYGHSGPELDAYADDHELSVPLWWRDGIIR